MIFNKIREIREEKKRNLEKEIEKYRNYFMASNEQEKRARYLEKYHSLQARHLHKYGKYHMAQGQKKLGITEIRALNDWIWIEDR